MKMQNENANLFIVILFCLWLTGLQAQSVKDIDGNVYHTVTIGKQVWMAENLKTTRFHNGDLIGTTTPATEDISGETTPKYQWVYDGNETNLETYGRLYTWYAVADRRNICPAGFHVPTESEWSTMIACLGGEIVAGDKLKETGINHWKSPNTGSTNESGFTARPGGYRYGSGSFYDVCGTGNWWSSTEFSVYNAWCYTIYYYPKSVKKHNSNKTNDLSVRCVRD
jgi:uncharacterized protein (TIGR02145 family)